jgi:hypothetical protein
MTTFSDLINKCLVELRQEVGVSVQQYSEDVIAAILQRQFNIFFDHYWWPAYYAIETFPLNGTTGAVTEDLTEKIKRFDDIRYVWHEKDTHPLTVMPPAINPSTVGPGTSFRKHYMSVPDSTIFRVVPYTLTGTVTVGYRMKPEPFHPNDEVKLDDDLLTNATCFNYLADDEDAPNSIKKFQEATAKREAQLREVMNRGPVPIGIGSPSPFTDWMMSP